MQTVTRCLVVCTLLSLSGLSRGEGPADVSDGHDPAFDRYVDLLSLGQALTGPDAARLTDLALQLAEGERILLRTHKSGITARSLLQKALRVAAQSQDQATLTRLAKAAEALGDRDLLSQIQNAQKLGGGSRTADSGLQVSPDTVSAEAFALLKDLYEQIRAAELVADASQLDAVEKQLAAAELSATQKDALQRMLNQARQNLPKEQTAADEALQRLASSTRGWFSDATGVSTPSPIQGFDPSQPIWHRPEDGGYTRMWEIEGSGSPPQPSFIDANGNIWSGSSVRGQSGQIVGRARLTYNGAGQAYWDGSSYRNSWGSASAVRAPAHDKGWGDAFSSGSPRPGQNLSPQQAKALLEWDQLSKQGRTRPTLWSEMQKRRN